jgi:predicted permease
MNRLLRLALLAVPAQFRDEVGQDLAEEAAAAASAHGARPSTWWMCRHAIGIGARIRWRRRRETGDALPRASFVDGLRHDLRFARRSLWRQPGWTLTAIATLALGIGANTAVFSVLNSTVLHPLPYRDADRLVIPWRHDAKAGLAISPSREIAVAWRENARSLEALEIYESRDVTWIGSGDPTLLHAAAISDTFLTFTGAPLLLGRAFAPEETQPGGPGVVILGEVLWRERFGADRSVLGRTMTLDGEPRTIVGVVSDTLRLAAQLQEHARRDVWLPLAFDPKAIGGSFIGRLRPGVSVDAAAQEFDAIVAAGHLDEAFGDVSFRTWLTRPGDNIGFKKSLMMLSWAVALVLLIACVNVAHLLLARGLTRERELAIRAALGAGRGRLVRQLMTECVILAGAGGLAGIWLGGWLLRGLTALRPAQLEVLGLASLDWTVIGAAIVATLVTGLAFGAIAAMRAARSNPAESLRTTVTASTAAQSRQRLRGALVIGEVAMAVVLLVGATLLIRSVRNLQQTDVGFTIENLFAVKVPLPPERCSGRAATPSVDYCRAQARAWLDRARAMPEVAAATLAATAPGLLAGFAFNAWDTRDHIQPADTSVALTAVNQVLPDFFGMLDIPIIKGTGFSPQSPARNEIVISEAVANRLWPGGDAVGKQMRARADSADAPDPWLTVVGVTADVPVQSLLRNEPERAIYYASAHGGYTLILRARPGADPAPAIRNIALELNKTLALPSVVSIASAFDASSVANSRFTMTLLTILAGLAVVLCSVGLYGVISYLVSARTKEIGIRMALGGSSRHIARLVLARAVSLTIAGLVIGLASARWLASLISSLLYGVAPFDPAAYAGGSVLLLAVAVIACVAPLWRAVRVDPLKATRSE